MNTVNVMDTRLESLHKVIMQKTGCQVFDKHDTRNVLKVLDEYLSWSIKDALLHLGLFDKYRIDAKTL